MCENHEFQLFYIENNARYTSENTSTSLFEAKITQPPPNTWPPLVINNKSLTIVEHITWRIYCVKHDSFNIFGGDVLSQAPHWLIHGKYVKSFQTCSQRKSQKYLVPYFMAIVRCCYLLFRTLHMKDYYKRCDFHYIVQQIFNNNYFPSNWLFWCSWYRMIMLLPPWFEYVFFLVVFSSFLMFLLSWYNINGNHQTLWLDKWAENYCGPCYSFHKPALSPSELQLLLSHPNPHHLALMLFCYLTM